MLPLVLGKRSTERSRTLNVGRRRLMWHDICDTMTLEWMTVAAGISLSRTTLISYHTSLKTGSSNSNSIIIPTRFRTPRKWAHRQKCSHYSRKNRVVTGSLPVTTRFLLPEGGDVVTLEKENHNCKSKSLLPHRAHVASTLFQLDVRQAMAQKRRRNSYGTYEDTRIPLPRLMSCPSCP
jgi:hypothetical protein